MNIKLDVPDRNGNVTNVQIDSQSDAPLDIPPKLINLPKQNNFRGPIRGEYVAYSFGFIHKETRLRQWLIKHQRISKILVLVVAMINTIAFCLVDYGVRQGGEDNNRLPIILETVCNSLFGLEIVLQCIAFGVCMGKYTYLRNPWSCINVLTFLSSWSIYFTMLSTPVQIFRVLRLLRLVRFFENIPYLRNTIENFFSSFFRIYKVLIPLVIVLFGFAIIGLHMLKGVTAFRCFTSEGILDIHAEYLCGELECPVGDTCLEHYDEAELRTEELFYGYDNFDTIYQSILAVFLFLNATGWSGTMFIFWKQFSQPMCAIYFISMMLIMNYIFSNLLLASLYESFIFSSAIKLEGILSPGRERRKLSIKRLQGASNNFNKIHIITNQSAKVHQQRQDISADQREFEKTLNINVQNQIVNIADNIIVLMSAIILSMSLDNQYIYTLDIILNFLNIAIIIIKCFYQHNTLTNIANSILALILLITTILLLVGYDNTTLTIMTSSKILRIFELIYHQAWFGSISILIRCLLSTLYAIKHLIILWLISALMLAIIGTEFFSNYVPDSEEVYINYDGLNNSLMAVINIFYNEEWHISMYQHALNRPQASFLFYLVCILLGQILFMRLLQALFLNEFGKNLNKEENQFPKIKIHKYIKKLYDSISKYLSPQQIEQQQTSEYSNVPVTENNVQDDMTCLNQKEIPQPQQKEDSKAQLIVENKYFRYFILGTILVSAIKSAMQNPLVNPNSDFKRGINIVFYITTAIFIFELALNLFAHGIILYLKKSIWNILSISILITNIFSIAYGNPNMFILHLLDSMRIFAFLKLGADTYEPLRIALSALVNAFAKMIQLSIFCLIILFIYSVFGFQLLKNRYFYCTLDDHEIKTELDCYDNGGNWINQSFQFDSITESINTLFIVASSEGWQVIMKNTWETVGVSEQPEQSHNRIWGCYFQIFFFFGNIIMLGMFITLVTETYFQTRDEYANLHLLTDKQREWFQIKEQIRRLTPLKMREYQGISKQASDLLNQINYVFLTVIGLNIIILSLFYARMPQQYENALQIMNLILIIIQACEVALRVIARRQTSTYVIEEIGIVVALIGWFLGDQILWTFSVTFQVFRSYRIGKNFVFITKVFSSMFAVLPNALSMLLIMSCLLYCYTVMGMDLFAFIIPQSRLNGYDMHFKDFFGALTALIRVASSEQWFYLLAEASHQQSPNFACLAINSYADYEQYGFVGCGTNLAYLYFISFHLIFSLMIFNLFIANILGAYDIFTKNEESAISKYQLKDVLSLWYKYDDAGTGYINYKEFWKLSSEIAIIFGVDQTDLLDINNKKHFLQALKIPIYEKIGSNIFCYKFHDVIIGLTRISVAIKYGVTTLEPDDLQIYKKVYGDEIPAMDKQFITTQFTSGDMASIIYIQQRFRQWKHRSLLKDNEQVITGISDLRKALIKKTLQPIVLAQTQ